MIAWVQQHIFIFYWIGGISFVLFVTTVIAVPYIITRLPPDFLYDKKHEERFLKVHFLLRLVVKVFKNIIGIILIVAGILMLVLPGQGIITVLIGLFLFDFPGKHKLIFLILRNPLVIKAINWIREKNGKEPLRIDSNE
ncbi:MAG: hypothetical protein JW881_19855 [Spirochaetales bacterium]|nr:hypothetical protein [Spirochaetales bacterium]